MKAPPALAHFLASIIAVATAASTAAAADDAPKLPPPAARAIDFAKDVQPILETHCYKCHGPKKQEASFRLDDPAAAKKGGDTGDDIVPGDSAGSLLILAVAGATDACNDGLRYGSVVDL